MSNIELKPRHRAALRNWTALNAYLPHANEADCEALIKYERSTLDRPTFVARITSRYRAARSHREMKELAR